MAANYLISVPALTKGDFKLCILFTEISLVLLSVQVYFRSRIHKQECLSYPFLQLFKSKLFTVAHIPC